MKAPHIKKSYIITAYMKTPYIYKAYKKIVLGLGFGFESKPLI